MAHVGRAFLAARVPKGQELHLWIFEHPGKARRPRHETAERAAPSDTSMVGWDRRQSDLPSLAQPTAACLSES